MEKSPDQMETDLKQANYHTLHSVSDYTYTDLLTVLNIVGYQDRIGLDVPAGYLAEKRCTRPKYPCTVPLVHTYANYPMY